MSRTPGPWTTKPGTFWVCDVGKRDDAPGVWSEALPLAGICMAYPFGTPQEDAEFIVRACNAHDDLLAALEADQAYFAHFDKCSACGVARMCDERDRLRSIANTLRLSLIVRLRGETP